MREKQAEGPVNCDDSELFIYLRALAEGYLPTFCLDTSRSAPSKSMNIASKSYRRGKKTVVFHGFPSLRMSRNSTEDRGRDSSISLLAGFPARTYPPPVGELESTANDPDCGAKWSGSLARYDRDSRLWRTPQLSLLGGLAVFSGTWPKWGTMRNGECWERRMWERRTKGTGYGLLRTPTVGMLNADRAKDPEYGTRKAEKGQTITLADQVKSAQMWPTPTVCGNYNRAGLSKNSGNGLATAATMWPTPAARDSKGANSREHCEKNGTGRKHMDQLANAVVHPDLKYPTPKTNGFCGGSGAAAKIRQNEDLSTEEKRSMLAGNGGQLNPTWVEWLIGWPLGWTDLKPLGMDKCRLVQRKHSAG